MLDRIVRLAPGNADRGLDMVNGAHQLLELVSKGRDEAGLPGTMAWLRHHGSYET